jgi:hypothetical protein
MSTSKTDASLVLEQIRAALKKYHHALDTRQHGGIAESNLVTDVETILDTPWIQGATLAPSAPPIITENPIRFGNL